MPKENTHLYFAKKVRETDKQLQGIINKNIQYFYLGSVFPDAFYYSKDKEIEKISDFIHHGEKNVPTNKLVFDLLDIAREKKDEQLLSFIFGFITHIYLDAVFHPVIFYLTGNYYDKDSDKKRKAIYKHRRYEVLLDEKINLKSNLNRLINTNIFNDERLFDVLSKVFNVSVSNLSSTFKRQYKLNNLFHKKYFLYILSFLNKIHILNNKIKVALFHGHLKDDIAVTEEIIYKDLFTGQALETTVNELWITAQTKTSSALKSAYKYYTGEESRKEAEININSENLDTGSKIFSADEIKFLK